MPTKRPAKKGGKWVPLDPKDAKRAETLVMPPPPASYAACIRWKYCGGYAHLFFTRAEAIRLREELGMVK